MLPREQRRQQRFHLATERASRVNETEEHAGSLADLRPPPRQPFAGYRGNRSTIDRRRTSSIFDRPAKRMPHPGGSGLDSPALSGLRQVTTPFTSTAVPSGETKARPTSSPTSGRGSTAT